ncbi:A-kinase anchor protein 9-like isoform X3 [Photinus pyralis]|uniref:A-kinase anchor protein 9-like isoform X3 n=1 Tax=Photinus pyralis TaxID=7054 RepID=UPI001267713A|nr:A-kinase anchor protein 9-like isoform X3 [Photinus pyralis]
MEDDRKKKVEAGREKLTAYKKKKEKHKHSPRSASASQSDTSLSASPPLSENAPKQHTGDVQSESSVISEHLSSHSESIENDRSLQEIEISNVPSNLSLFENLSSDENTEHISHENKPSPLDSSNSTDPHVITKTNVDSQSNVQSILNEILRSEEFKSDSEHTLHHTDSNENSFNLFKDVNLNDSFLEEYGTKPNVYSTLGDTSKLKQLEEIINAKETTINALTSELESWREINSSAQSTPSLNTSTTDYKNFPEEYYKKIVKYDDDLQHRDILIQQLTDALKRSCDERVQLERDSQSLATDIAVLQKQLAHTSDLLGKKKEGALVPIRDCSAQTDTLEPVVTGTILPDGDTTDGIGIDTQHFQSSDEPQGDESILNLDKECLSLERTLNAPQIELMRGVKESINAYVEAHMGEHHRLHQLELKKLENKLENEQMGYEAEIAKLKELLNGMNCHPDDVVALRTELEAKHAKEMEELRTYFEKKCAEVEKNYSEEVFSQHSRKMSESSLCSESLDFHFTGSHLPSGPGGDSSHLHIELPKIEPPKPNFKAFTKSDCVKLKQDLSDIVKTLAEYDLERISQEDHADLITSLEKCNLQQVFKFDLSAFKNKCNAELEILREDYENRIEVQNTKNMERIDSLKSELEEALRNAELNIHTAVQEVASSGEFELEEVVQSYERRLQEQVTMAKFDILNALELQVQTIAAGTCDDSEWPTELLQIRNKFVEKYEREINELKEQHEEEIAKLKEDHFKILNGTVERARRKSLRDASENEAEIIQERDSLLKTTTLLRQLIAQLLKYFRECEDELNNTLVDELLKKNIGRNLTELEIELNLNDESISHLGGKKRVHFTPKVDKIISATPDGDTNISLDMRNELEACLHRLKADANAILNLSLTFNKPRTDDEVPIDSTNRDLSIELEEAKNEHLDLQQQIEAANKKLRATCRFLEEQSAEREQERDEAQKEIACLREQIRERAKDRASCEHISDEQEEDVGAVNSRCRNFKTISVCNVERLEMQIRDMTKVIEAGELKQNEIESEKQEAIEKIFVLRDIIRDLESEVEAKTAREDKLTGVISELEEIISQQTARSEDLTKQLDGQCLQEHIDRLEDEVQRLKLHSEFAGSEGALKQLKLQLNDFEVGIDERTRELEGLLFVISTTNCSSPSEDMSVRDQIRPRTPSVLDECDLPLQQLARLKEKLIKHSRAEDAAVKRIHDLEMEVDSVKHDLNEVQNERDILQDQVSEHLILISSLQMRLDDQRLRAEQVQKQTNTSLEVRIYDLENEIKNLMEVITARDKTVKNLNKTVEETKKKLKDQELELNTKVDDDVICQLQDQVKRMQAENAALLKRINDDAQNAQVLPNLVDNILADKNKDIEKLQEKLDKTQTQLNDYLSLNLDREQLKTLSRLSSSERALSDILSLVDVDSPERLRKVERQAESLSGSINVIPYKQAANETEVVPPASRFEPEISRIERVGKPHLFFSLDSSLPKPNSTEIHKSTEKRVQFEDTVFNAAIEKLHAEILEQKNELFEKDELIREYSDRLNVLTELEANVIKLQEKLEETENALQNASSNFEAELKNMKDVEMSLHVDIAEKKMLLMKRDEQLQLAEEDSVRKDQMYINLVKEKRELEKAFNQLQNEMEQLRGNTEEITNLKSQITEMGDSLSKVQALETEVSVKQEEIAALESKASVLQLKLKEFELQMKQKTEITEKLQKDLANKESQIRILSEEVQTKTKEVEALQRDLQDEQKKLASEFEVHIKDLKNLLIDRETEIEILNEDAQRYQDDISKLEDRLKSYKAATNQEHELKLSQHVRDIAAKDLEIVKLNIELDDTNRTAGNLHEALKEKEKVIDQMSEDSKSLRFNLETIQNKMKESGNVLDLRRRLEEERRLNRILQEQLKAEIANPKPVDMTASIEEITGEVRKQLDYSAELDSSILSALENSDREDGDDLRLLRQNIAKEKALRAELNNLNSVLQQNIHELQTKYRDAEEKISNLQSSLANEKQAQLADANMLEQLRERLRIALDNENAFANVLDNEKQIRLHLEEQVVSLKRKLNSLSSGENSKTEVTEYKSLPTLETMELNRLRGQVKTLEEELACLHSSVKDLKSDKLKNSATLKYTKDMLDFKNSEIEKLQAHIGGLKGDEVDVQQKWAACKVELEHKTRELENSRALIGELESEERQMKEQIEKLNKKFAKAIEREKKLMAEVQGDQLKKTVPDQFLNKMKDLNEMVQKHIKENEQMAKVITNLNTERSALQNRIMELEELNHVKFPFDDPVERANQLFAKFLRSESYRKALVWQKKYIVSLLASYQNHPLPFESATVTPAYARLSGRRRFRAVIACIMAMIRMQFLVQRWHSGVRGIVRIRNRQPRIIAMPYAPVSSSAAQFQVGQPVSSQNFPFQIISPVYSHPVLVPSTSRHRDTSTGDSDGGASSDPNPWSGQTPPSKDYCKGRGGFSTKPLS